MPTRVKKLTPKAKAAAAAAKPTKAAGGTPRQDSAPEMPRPVAASAIPSPPPSIHPLLAHSHAHAARSFRSHVSSVLHEASIICLRRALSGRAREHLHSLPEERLLGDSTTEELLRVDPRVMKVTEGDIERCYAFSARVGNRWAEVLQRQGYGECAEMVFDVVKRGRYLEEPSSSGETPAQNGTDAQKEGENSKLFASAYTALHALRRYPPDCDGSGLPSQHLPVLDNESEKISSARKVIQQIDDMARRGETGWNHGWDAIEEAVERNKKRMEYGLVRVGTDKGVPEKQSVGIEATGGEEGEESNAKPRASRKRRRVVLAKSDPQGIEGGGAGVADEDTCAISERGRPASSVGDLNYSWEDVLESMSAEERRALIESAIHPPYPHESEMKGEANDEVEDDDGGKQTETKEQHHDTVVCGALKEIGLTHLWEMTRHLSSDINDGEAHREEDREQNPFEGGQETIYGASEALASFQSQRLKRQRKNTLARAARERMGRRTLAANELKSEYANATSYGKVKWSEDGGRGANKVRESDALVGSTQHAQLVEHQQQKWLEMDLGECTIELADDREQPEPEVGGSAKAEKKEKRFYAFRSLELALKY
ncbi:hypothetical protein ACHAXT_005551 [Thalassiosira profunda]